MTDEYDKNWEDLRRQDRIAKQAGILLGRYIQEPYADSHAVYVITHEYKHKVKIKVVTGIGDDWVIPYWGEETTIEKDYAESSIGFRDSLAEAFKRQQQERNNG